MENTNTLADALRAAGLDLYHDRRSDSKARAQDCLEGRTHYVDDGTLRYFHSRIVRSDVCRSGAFFYIIESCALNSDNTARGFRGVVFDIFGTAVYRPSMDETYKTSATAQKAMWAWFDSFDEAVHYVEALRSKAARLEREATATQQAARTIERACEVV